MTDEQIDAIFHKWAGKNDYGAAYLRCYPEGFRHIARAVLEGARRGWQPIETAPKYTEVLCWRADQGVFISKLTTPDEVISTEEMEREGLEFPDDFEEWFNEAWGWQEGSERPTHWMPLPADPAEGAEQPLPQKDAP